MRTYISASVLVLYHSTIFNGSNYTLLHDYLSTYFFMILKSIPLIYISYITKWTSPHQLPKFGKFDCYITKKSYNAHILFEIDNPPSAFFTFLQYFVYFFYIISIICTKNLWWYHTSYDTTIFLIHNIYFTYKLSS